MRLAVMTKGGAEQGGSNQYAWGVLEAIKRHFSADQYMIFVENDRKVTSATTNHSVSLSEKKSFFLRLMRFFASYTNIRFTFGQYRQIYDYQPNLIVCTNPSNVGSFLKIPYISPIHDLMHRIYRGLPEISWSEALKREFRYRITTRTNLISIVNCEAVKMQVKEFYGVPDDRIEVVNEVPPPYFFQYENFNLTEIKQTLSSYQLPDRFLLYPAQLWSHKNHLRLLQALSLLYEEKGLKIPLVNVGSNKEKSTYRKIRSFLNTSPIRKYVWFLGYIDNMEMVELYKRAAALVFPSINISTGIPVAEALSLGLPVLCSNKDSYKEQVGDAGLTFDPFDIEDMAKKICLFWTNADTEHHLRIRASEKGKRIMPESFGKQWIAVIEKALKIVNSKYG